MLSRIRNLDYVILLCQDWEKMRAFYRDTLGFPVYRDWDGWCELRLGGSLLTLRPRGRSYDGSEPEGAGVQLAFRVAPNEIDACWRELLEAGVEIWNRRKIPPMANPPNGTRIGRSFSATPSGTCSRSMPTSRTADAQPDQGLGEIALRPRPRRDGALLQRHRRTRADAPLGRRRLFPDRGGRRGAHPSS